MTDTAPDKIVAPADRAEAARCIGFSLRKAVRAVGQVYDSKLEPVGLKGTQFSLLLATSIAGQIAVGKLADIMVMDRTTLTRNLRPLKALGYLEMFSGQDKRVRIIQLTSTGRDILEQAKPLWRSAQAAILAGIGEPARDEILQNLAAVIEAARQAKTA